MTPHPDFARLTTLIAAQSGPVAAAAANGVLADWLYSHWYLRPETDVADDPAPTPFATLDQALCAIVDMLSPWTDGWIILAATADGGCQVGRGEARRFAAPGRYAGHNRPGLPPVPGDRVAMPEHLSWLDAGTGQWAAQSAVPPAGALARLYVNVGATGIGHAVERIAGWLIDEDIPFRMKCPASAAGFARADALVVYLDRDDWPASRVAALPWLREIAPLLRAGSPALTLTIAPGVGFAEDPGDGRSFGQQRCALLAAAIRAIPDESIDLAPHLMRAVAAAGISSVEPWRCQ